MLGDGDPRTTIRGTRGFDTRAVSGTVAAVFVIAIGVALVAFSATMLSGMAETPGEQPRAATDVELGPGGVVVELEAVGDADSVLIQRNGELVRELVDPQSGIRTVIEASNVSTGDTITVVGESDGNRIVLDSVTVDDRAAASGSGSGGGGGGAPSGSVADIDVPADINGDVDMPFDGEDVSGDTTGDGSDGSQSDDEESEDTEDPGLAVAWTADDLETQSLQVGDSGPALAGDGSGAVTAVDRSDGTQNWSVSVGDGPVVGVAGGDTDTVYAGTVDGTVTRIDGGSVNWSVDLGTELAADDTVQATHVAHANGSTYAAVSDVDDTTASAIVSTGPDGTVQSTTTPESSRVTALESSQGGGAVVAETDRSGGEHRVRRVDENGTSTWNVTLPREPTAVTSADGQVTVALAANATTTSSVWRLTDDASPAWRHETTSDANVTAVAVDGDRTYVAVGDADGTVRALDDTGTQVWQGSLANETDGAGSPSVTSLRVGPGGDLYAGTPALTRLTVED